VSELIRPHGGRLVDRVLRGEELEAAKGKCEELKKIALCGAEGGGISRP